VNGTLQYCPLTGRHLSVVTKLGGSRIEVACPEYDAADGECRIKRDANAAGQLLMLLDAVGGGNRGVRLQCDFE